MPTRRQYLTALAGGLAVGTIARADDIRRYKNRSSLRFLTAPEQFVQPEKTKHTPDLRYFIRHFTQRTDAAYGLYDVVTDVETVQRTKEGDCADLANFVASWLLYRRDTDVQLLVLRPTAEIAQAHVAVINEDHVYDATGHYRSVDQYVDYFSMKPVARTTIRQTG